MRGDEKLINKIKSHKPSDLSICTITLAEIFYGIEKPPVKKKVRRTKIERINSQLEIHPFLAGEAAEGVLGATPIAFYGQPYKNMDIVVEMAKKYDPGVPQGRRKRWWNGIPEFSVPVTLKDGPFLFKADGVLRAPTLQNRRLLNP